MNYGGIHTQRDRNRFRKNKAHQRRVKILTVNRFRPQQECGISCAVLNLPNKAKRKFIIAQIKHFKDKAKRRIKRLMQKASRLANR